ncbi:MAG: NAD(P)-dependent oxidoreductase [Dehalococcoidia bacterium]|nr:NAD(P)-dependent oxidoreductase [Dehalococcoidia bacterium]
MAVLIIGSGLVGSQIARILVDEGERPVILDVASQPEALADIVDVERLTMRRGDILNPLDVVRVIREDAITRVIHTAANPLLTLGAQRDPYGAIQVNIMGTVNVLEAARLHGLERVVVTSSNVLSYYLTGGEDNGDTSREEAFPRPATFYSATKQAVESLGLNYARWCNLDVVAVRFGAVAGPWRGRGGGGPSNIFRELVERSIRGEEATVPSSTMDWVYSKDAAAGAVLALKARGLTDRVFNISMGQVTGPDHIIAAVKAVIPGARIRIETQHATALSVRNMERPIDLTRARKQLGYTPKYDLPNAVRDYVDWYRTRRP